MVLRCTEGKKRSNFKSNLPCALLTYLLILGDTHDLKGLQGLCKQVLVLLPRNGHVPVGEETVVVVILKEEFI